MQNIVTRLYDRWFLPHEMVPQPMAPFSTHDYRDPSTSSDVRETNEALGSRTGDVPLLAQGSWVLRGRQLTFTRPFWWTSSQHTGADWLQDTKSKSDISIRPLFGGRRAYQSVPPRPMTSMGLQSRPMGVFTSWIGMLRRPRAFEAAGAPAGWTWLQHWTGPALHEPCWPTHTSCQQYGQQKRGERETYVRGERGTQERRPRG